MSELLVREVAHGSPEYDATVALRRRVLRLPLGLDFTAEELVREDGQTHLAVFEGDEVVACLVLVPVDATTVKMRQVAVAPDRQGAGLGRRLVEEFERVAGERGHADVVLHARETAVPFYLRLGYTMEGEPFEEVGVPHRAMRKRLPLS